MTVRRDIVAIGGSAGSGAPLRTIVAALPDDLAASVLVCTHLPPRPAGTRTDMLARCATLPVCEAIDGMPLQHGRIYVAAPDRHMLVIGETLRLGTGPRENMARPSIDALFRSVALSAGPRAIGVVLSGLLDDGAAGLCAIKARGGLALVQHPLEATADAMPLAALQAAEVDHVVAADRLGGTVAEMVGSEAPRAPPPNEALRLEVDIAFGERLGSRRLGTIAVPSALSCPDCAGVLSEVRGSRPLRFRCQIGHGYTAEALTTRHGALDKAVRVAMRIMEERVTLVERMAQDARDDGRPAVAALYEARGEEYRGYAATLREAATAALREGRTSGRAKQF